MKRFSILAALAATLLLATAVAGEEHHIKASLVPNGASGVTGSVQLTQLPGGGAELTVIARGLTAGTTYSSFYYESDNCTEPADLLGEFQGGPGGTGEVHGRIDDDLDEVGSVSVRLGPGYGTLLACATTH